MSDFVDPYELLEISHEARDEEISKAFRKKSLKVHPDRNDSPQAAQKFHELKQAQELLLDPQRRSEIDASLRKRRAHLERYAKHDEKKRKLQDELEESERAFKRSRHTQLDEKKQQLKEEELREAGRKLREEREKLQSQKIQTPLEEEDAPDMDKPEPGPQDSTLRIKYTLTTRPDLSTKSSLLSLLRPFGPLEGDEESIVLSLKPPKKHPEKPPKFANAIVQFKRCEDAFGAVCASNRVERGLKDVQIDWVTGEEPKYVKWLRERPPPSKPTVPTFTTTTPTSLDLDSSITLMRLRQAERDRLAREILEQEGEA